MKLLLYSHFFSPSVGGVETVVLALATGLTNRLSPSGSTRFETTLVTQAPADDARDSLLPFRVVRQPSSSQLRRLIREADVVHAAGAAILPVISALLAGKPVVGEHHGFPTRQSARPGNYFNFRGAYPVRDILSALATLPTWRCRSSGF